MGATGRVLVVDDDLAVAEAIAATLGRRYAVRCAATGSDAITAVCEQAYDLILLDHRLPDLLGTDVLRLIKRFFPATTVLFMTGQGSEDVAVEAFHQGARDYLKKPFPLAELVRRVDALFAARQESQEPTPDPYLRHLDPSLTRGTPDPDSDRGWSILRAVRHIEAHLANPGTLAEVARLAGMSRFHFCRQFRQVTGLSFRAFVLRKRIDRAKGLLQDGTRPIGEVAALLGFQDLTHFGRVFRRLEHVLPSEFRRAAAAQHALRQR